MKRILAALMVASALVTSVSCANKRHVIVVVDSALYEVLSDIHVEEQTALCGQPSCAGVTQRMNTGWTDAKSQAFNQKLLPAVQAGRQLNTVLAAWEPGQLMPQAIHDLSVSLGSALTNVTNEFPDGELKSKILADIGSAQRIVLGAIDVFIGVAAGGK